VRRDRGVGTIFPFLGYVVLKVNLLNRSARLNFMNKPIEDFVKAWEEQITKIEKNPIDERGTHWIFVKFDRGRLGFVLEKAENYKELANLESKLRVALEISRCKYYLQNRSIWARIAESFAMIGYRKSIQG
jgi:hypothetical protein